MLTAAEHDCALFVTRTLSYWGFGGRSQLGANLENADTRDGFQGSDEALPVIALKKLVKNPRMMFPGQDQSSASLTDNIPLMALMGLTAIACIGGILAAATDRLAPAKVLISLAGLCTAAIITILLFGK